ncbi:CLUMA_CG007576, isoform A [Clunio marinus]|uniref:CLUMA_CG007576, isoform A n=1 Tax=Clunio marinus TaxID=568069 RepID=A0A1J1I381_9DIPT|nr:CLUMA_CG007576, isoform A [Clunio marinus]
MSPMLPHTSTSSSSIVISIFKLRAQTELAKVKNRVVFSSLSIVVSSPDDAPVAKYPTFPVQSDS